ncbi:penicillin-binding protein [Spirochaetota bacterium]
MDKRNIRTTIVFIILLILFLVAVARTFYLSILQPKSGIEESKYINIERGGIYDSSLMPLAQSIKKYNVYFNIDKYRKISNEAVKRSFIETLLHMIPLDDDELEALITKDQKVTLLMRGVDEDIYKKLVQLRSSVLFFDEIYVRDYPNDKLLCHTMGFAGIENIGLAGLENYYDDILIPYQKISTVRERKHLVLCLNRDVQMFIESKLLDYIVKYRALAGSVVIQSVKDGRILGIANYPTFSPKRFEKENYYLFKNIAVSDYIEPGSIFKIFMAAYLIEHSLIRYNSSFFCPGYYELANHKRVRCIGEHEKVDFIEILKRSCNTGIIKACERINEDDLYDYLKLLNFGDRTGIDLPGESKGIVRKASKWGLRTKATIPIGQGIGVTPIQLITAFSALINGGILYRPNIVRAIVEGEMKEGKRSEISKKIIRKVISRDTSDAIRKLLRKCVEPDATGHRAVVRGLDIGGKTGTAQRVNMKEGGYYIDKYNSLYIGAFPMKDPVISILVVFYEPKGSYYGGTVSAPLFAEIAEGLINLFNISFAEDTVYIESDRLKVEQKRPKELQGRMPNIIGYSMRDAMITINPLLKEYKAKLRISGAGYVFRQAPHPGESIDTNSSIELYLK